MIYQIILRQKKLKLYLLANGIKYDSKIIKDFASSRYCIQDNPLKQALMHTVYQLILFNRYNAFQHAINYYADKKDRDNLLQLANKFVDIIMTEQDTFFNIAK